MNYGEMGMDELELAYIEAGGDEEYEDFLDFQESVGLIQ